MDWTYSVIMLAAIVIRWVGTSPDGRTLMTAAPKEKHELLIRTTLYVGPIRLYDGNTRIQRLAGTRGGLDRDRAGDSFAGRNVPGGA